MTVDINQLVHNNAKNKELYKELTAVISTYLPPVEEFSRPQKREDLIHDLLMAIGIRMLVKRKCPCKTCQQHSRFHNIIANTVMTMENCHTLAENAMGEEINKL